MNPLTRFLFGLEPDGHHATNLALHLIACCLVYALLARRTPDPRAALLLALVYAVHPVIPSEQAAVAALRGLDWAME